MAKIYQRITQVATTPTTVLITGESGTGKELVARAIHLHSARSAQPFVAFNVAAFPDSLIDSMRSSLATKRALSPGRPRGSWGSSSLRKVGRSSFTRPALSGLTCRRNCYASSKNVKLSDLAVSNRLPLMSACAPQRILICERP